MMGRLIVVDGRVLFLRNFEKVKIFLGLNSCSRNNTLCIHWLKPSYILTRIHFLFDQLNLINKIPVAHNCICTFLGYNWIRFYSVLCDILFYFLHCMSI